MPAIQNTNQDANTEPSHTSTEFIQREEAFWKSLPLSKPYKTDQIDHAASLLSAIANADYTNPIPTQHPLPQRHPVISLPPLIRGTSVAVYTGQEWCLGVFQKLDYGSYVVHAVDQCLHVACDDLTDVDDTDSEIEEIHQNCDPPVYSVRGSHLRILCEHVVYVVGENVMAVFPGCTTFYPACIVGKCHSKWIVKFDDDESEEPEDHAAVGRLVHPALIFKA